MDRVQSIQINPGIRLAGKTSKRVINIATQNEGFTLEVGALDVFLKSDKDVRKNWTEGAAYSNTVCMKMKYIIERG